MSKYNKNGTDTFSNFQPFIEGAKLPKTFYNGDEEDYQKYTDGFAPGAKPKIIDGYTIRGNEADSTGYEIGSVVKAGFKHIIFECGDDFKPHPIKIYREEETGDLIIAHGPNYREKKRIPKEELQQLYGAGENGITRLGVLFVAAGGSGGHWTQYDGGNKCSHAYYNVPGGSGGGGGTVWGVINLEKPKPYYITGGSRSWIRGGNGGHMYLKYGSPNTTKILQYGDDGGDGIIAYAEGGYGGDKGTTDRQVNGGRGGSGKVYNATDFFTPIGIQAGENGISWNYANLTEDTKMSQFISLENNYTIKFLNSTDRDYITMNSNDAMYGVGNKDDWSSCKLPGGNSWGQGGNAKTYTYPTKGGGGISQSYFSDTQTIECGARGHWILFY